MVRILLRELLFERRWSRAELSRATGIRPNTIGDYYNELVDRVNLEHLNLICSALNCNISDILEYTPDENPILYHRTTGTIITNKENV